MNSGKDYRNAAWKREWRHGVVAPRITASAAGGGAMIAATELKAGTVIKLDGELHSVISS